MKTIFRYVMMATMAAFVLSACKNSGETEQEAANYSLLTVTTDSVTLTEAFTANIQGQQDVEIMPQVSGTIKKVCIVEGQTVKKGQTLFSPTVSARSSVRRCQSRSRPSPTAPQCGSISR